MVGGSLGGAVALEFSRGLRFRSFAGAVVNAAVRMRSVVDLFPGDHRYDLDAESAVDGLDFLARADRLAGRAPLSVVSGELDHPALRADALDLVEALGERGELLSIAGPAHALAEEPGTGPAPRLPAVREVDAGPAGWFGRHLPGAA